jgi:acyl carrier protein
MVASCNGAAYFEIHCKPMQTTANQRSRDSSFKMADLDALKSQIKQMMVEELMLPIGVEEIAHDALIFHPQGLGLDSVDALQLVVAIEKRFGLKLGDAAAAREVLQSVNTIANALVAKGLV